VKQWHQIEHMYSFEFSWRDEVGIIPPAYIFAWMAEGERHRGGVVVDAVYSFLYALCNDRV
jgi:hypothetical protein